MQIRHLRVRNFRGIAALEWSPAESFCCLIGPGDSGKSTVLDAVEAALSSRWFTFSENDFFGCASTTAIEIEVTLGELSRDLKSDAKFGLFIRGWSAAEGVLSDEPGEADEPVLTVKLTVDASLEPVWALVCNRVPDPRVLSNRDRALFGVVRLSGDDARHLAWGQGSVLARLTGRSGEAGARLAEAYRVARDSARLGDIESLTEAALTAELSAKRLGAYVGEGYGPGLELGRSGLSASAIALHDGDVPLRMAGLGSRRLATLAIQKSAVKEGAIILIDEIEHGLEPHRIIGAIAQLKKDQSEASGKSLPVGQVIMTTHSDVALSEVGANYIHFANMKAPSSLELRRPSLPEQIRPLLRFTPRALFARKILVCEGRTEVGLLLGIREFWPARHDGIPVEQLGGAIADGNGSEACAMALALSELGYCTALFRDSDDPLTEEQSLSLNTAGVVAFEYGNSLNTEQALFLFANEIHIQQLLDYARKERGKGAVDENIHIVLSGIPRSEVMPEFEEWSNLTGLSGLELRQIIGTLAAKKRWFKDERIARGLAPIVWSIAEESPLQPPNNALSAAEAWLYA